MLIDDYTPSVSFFVHIQNNLTGRFVISVLLSPAAIKHLYLCSGSQALLFLSKESLCLPQ